MLKKYNMETCNPINTPMEVRGDRELYGVVQEGEQLLEQNVPYFSAIGELMWLANRTRPDIAFAVNVLARHATKPTRRHWNGIKRILRYLKKTADFGLLYQRRSDPGLRGFADAGFRSDPITAKSQGGYVFQTNGAAISWKSRKQTVVATSTAHAELIALYEGTREAVWVSRLRKFVERSTGQKDEESCIPLYEDNEACIKMVQNGYVRSDATKHIDPRYQAYLKEENGRTVEVQSVSSQENVADIFTKSLPAATHWKHLRGLGVISLAEVSK
jgi:hypothetical protein